MISSTSCTCTGLLFGLRSGHGGWRLQVPDVPSLLTQKAWLLSLVRGFRSKTVSQENTGNMSAAYHIPLDLRPYLKLACLGCKDVTGKEWQFANS